MWRERVDEQFNPCRYLQLLSNPGGQQTVVKIDRTIILVSSSVRQLSGVKAARSRIVVRLEKVELTPAWPRDPAKC